MSRCEHCGHDPQEVKLTYAFMHSVLNALSLILHKLDKVLERLPEPIGRPTTLELEFGQPKDKEIQS